MQQTDQQMNQQMSEGTSPEDVVVLVTTVDDEAQVRSMARRLVEQQLAACVHITRIDSIYHWAGAVQEHGEWQLSCKTMAARATVLQQAILALHPYEVPMLYRLPVAWAHQPYGQWVAQTCSGEA